jgi:hypothetical protein
MIAALAVAIVCMVSPSRSSFASDDPILDAYLAACEKFRFQKAQDPYILFKDIARVKIHWLKPRENADGSVTLRWEMPDAWIMNYHLLDTANILVIDAATGKSVAQKSAPLKYKSLAYKFPALGKYNLQIWASNKNEKSTAKTSFIYTYRKYVAPILAKDKKMIIERFYAFLSSHASELERYGNGVEQRAKALEDLIKKWDAIEIKVIGAELESDWQGVIINFNDYDTVYARLDHGLLFTDDEGDENPYVTDFTPPDLRDEPCLPQNPDIDVYVPPPVLPVSRRAIVVHGLGFEEMGGAYRREVIEQALRDAGFDDLTVINSDDEGTLEQLTHLDDGQYGFIYYLHHGGPVELDGEECFGVGIPPYYDLEPDIQHIGCLAGVQRINDVPRHYRIFTRLFIDTYCNDMSFPRSCIYWYSCGSAISDPIVNDFYLSFVNKGVTCGWIGMNASRAEIYYNNFSTGTFFNNIAEKAYLIDAVEAASRRPNGSQRLLNEEVTAYNRALYTDHDFVDLGIRRIKQVPGRMMEVTIGNEGIISPAENTEVTLGTRIAGLPDVEYTLAVRTAVPARLQQGETFDVLVPPTEGPPPWEVGLDLLNDVPQDTIRANNARLARNSDLLPDVIITACERLDDGNVGITIGNCGLDGVFLRDNEFFIDVLYEGRDPALRVSSRYPGESFAPGTSYQMELQIPVEVHEVRLTADSTDLIEEFNEDNTFDFVL